MSSNDRQFVWRACEDDCVKPFLIKFLGLCPLFRLLYLSSKCCPNFSFKRTFLKRKFTSKNNFLNKIFRKKFMLILNIQTFPSAQQQHLLIFYSIFFFFFSLQSAYRRRRQSHDTRRSPIRRWPLSVHCEEHCRRSRVGNCLSQSSR